MKEELKKVVVNALNDMYETGLILQKVDEDSVRVMFPNVKEKGDYCTNVALREAGKSKISPVEFSKLLSNTIIGMGCYFVESIIPDGGFVNFILHSENKYEIVKDILHKKEDFGRSENKNKGKILVEYVSANPTGPLHVGHGRGAAYGSSLTSILDFAGYDVDSEYYVNDAGRQMDILTVSVLFRLMKLNSFPSNGYKGDYVKDIAEIIHKDLNNPLNKISYSELREALYLNAHPDLILDKEGNAVSGDKEKHIDSLIENAKSFLGFDNYSYIFETTINFVINDIRSDLSEMNIEFSNWFNESSLFNNRLIDEVISKLTKNGFTYEHDGALWFKSADFFDENDRVLVRENGIKTYFASDIAYHYDKLNRGYDEIINVWGSDHHGYIPRLRSALSALGLDYEKVHFELIQFATLYKDGKILPMSTRSGQFITLRDLRNDIGNDATRFFYVSYKCNKHMNFDLDAAKKMDNENPMFYIQYAHARCCALFNRINDVVFRSVNPNLEDFNLISGLENLNLLNNEHENKILISLIKFNEVIERSAKNKEPHLLTHYLHDLAGLFHSYYSDTEIITDGSDLRNARLCLVESVKTVLKNGLNLLGVSAPSYMKK